MKNQATTRKRLIVTLVAAAIAIPVAGAALAGAYGNHGMGMGMDKGPGCEMGGRHAMGERGHQDRMDGRLAFLEAEIGITAEQQADWERFEQALRDNMAERGERGPGKDAAQSAPDRIAGHIEHMRERLERMTKMQAAVAELYTVLTPEQQQEADQLLPPMHGGGRGHGGKGHSM